jgi:hypothetical protein
MPADANLFQAYLRPPKSVLEYQADYDQADARKNALQLSTMELGEKTQANQRAQKVRNALEMLGAGATDEDRINALKATATPEGFAQADALDKSIQERAKTKAVTGKDTAEADAKKLDSTIKAHDFHLQQLGAVADPESAKAWAIAGLQSGVFTPEQFQRGYATIPTDPAGFAQWKQNAMQGGVTATEQLKQAQAKLIADNNNKTQIATNAATNATHVQTTAMTNATSRANNRDTIAGENMRAGTSADGSVSPEVEAQAQAIAKGQLLPPSGAALINPKNARVLARVMEINPSYDATTVLAKKKAANDFTTGSQGNSMRSFAVAGQHLDQLGTLVDALDNGNAQLVNKIGNAYSQQTGNPAVTNFDAAKDVVSKEVVKAIVAGGGGVAEREELSKLMDNAKSPAQLKGVIRQYRNLMAAQHDALLQQRRAAGLPDSTLPNYTEANGSAPAAGVPSDIASILQKHGGK